MLEIYSKSNNKRPILCMRSVSIYSLSSEVCTVVIWYSIGRLTHCQEFKVHDAKKLYGTCKCNIPPANMDEHHQK